MGQRTPRAARIHAKDAAATAQTLGVRLGDGELLVPHCLFVLGLTWFLSALAVYVRDVAQTIGIVVTMLMFLSPVFFPASALPADWRVLVDVNPLAAPIEQFRDLVVWGRLPDVAAVTRSAALGALTAWAGYAWFQKARRGFADVL